MMNRTKRKLNHHNDFDTKKHVRTQFEQMSNEIFYEVFDYLDSFDVFHGFVHLNQRFQIIIKSLAVKISLKNRTSKQITDIYNHILIPCQQRIHAIEIDDSNSHLSTLKYLQKLSRTFSLRFHVNNYLHERVSHIQKQILQLHYLESYHLIVSTKEKVQFQLPLPTEQQFNSLKYLNLSHRFYFNELISILHYTPQLQHLFCDNLLNSNANTNIEILVLNLRELRIKNCQVDFDVFRRFLQQISSHLQLIRIHDYYAPSFISLEQWKRLISQYLHSLNSIRIKCSLEIIENINKIFDNDAISWFTHIRKYRFHFEVQSTEMFYILSSSNPSNNLLQSSVELSINNRSIRPWRVPILSRFQSTFQTISFTSLYLFLNDLLIDNFMILLSSLPNLQSLKISSTLVFRDETTIELLSHSNRIKHVWTWMDWQHVRLLTNICTQMEYFEIIGIRNENFHELIKFLFEKIPIDLIRLRQLRFYVYNNNDSVSNALKSFIRNHKIFRNSRLQCTDGFLSLEW